MKKTKTNPLGLRIGQRIKIRAKVYLGYNTNGKRKVWTYDTFEITCYILRSVLRAEGEYIKAYNIGYEQDDYEQSQLKVSNYVRLYECATSITGKTFLVRPKDILLI